MTEYLDGELVPADAGPVVLAHAGTAHAVATAGDVLPLYRHIRNAWLGSLASANTVAAYRRDSDEFFAWCEEFGFPPLQLTRAAADGYRHYLGEKLSDATRARKLSALSSLTQYALENPAGLTIEGNPWAAVKRPKVSKDAQTAGLTLEQAQRLFDVAAEVGTAEHLIVRLLLHTGMRVSELANATAADMRREGEYTTLRIRRKGGEKSRVPLPAEAVDAIRAHLHGRAGPLLLNAHGGPLDRAAIARTLARLARMAGLPPLTPHVLRHTAATLAILYGGEDGKGASVHEVQEMLGHSVVTTTMRYVHAAGRVERSAVHGLAAALRRREAEQ